MLLTPRWLILLPALCTSVVATSLARRWENARAKHEWRDLPKGWHVDGNAPSDHVLELRIALKKHRFDELVDHLYQVSDPAHERYGKHLSKEQVHALVAPHGDTVDIVDEWLMYHGIKPGDVQRSLSGSWLSCNVPVAQAERMLNTKYYVFRHADSGERIVRTMTYALPDALHGHIQAVVPTTYFGSLRPMRATSFLEPNVLSTGLERAMAQLKGTQNGSTVPGSCADSITPACLRALYKTAGYTPQAAKKNKIGIAGYLDQFINDTDLQMFLGIMRPDVVNASYSLELVNGGINNQSQPGDEAALDIQYTESLTFPTPNIYYSTKGSPPFNPDSVTQTNSNEPYLDWLNYVLSRKNIPQTISTSYGDDEQTVPQDYAEYVCELFALLGAQGTSVVFASGDFAVGGGDCKANDGTNQVRFQPVFPASCPFVTAVGSTNKVNPEVAASFSGAGFSNYFARPKYQDAAVAGYFERVGSVNAGLFNASGRAYPDVSAQGVSYQIILGGRHALISGTSASAPTFASVVTLLNDHLIVTGKPPLGFLNPLIYSGYADAGFNDITSGNNFGCNTSGFEATTGWDPITGFGTPNFEILKEIVSAGVSILH